MKILHVIDQVSQTHGGGSAKVVYDMAYAQAKLGHVVTIYSSDWQAKGQQPPLGVKQQLFKCVANPWGKVKIAPGMLGADYKADIIHCHNYFVLTSFLVAHLGVPFVMQAHGSCPPITKPLFNFIWRHLVLKRAGWCIADAEAEAHQYLREGVDLKWIAVIPVGINMDEYKRIPPRQISTKKRVLYVGRFIKLKGIDLLIKAFGLLDMPDVNLQLVGVDYGFENEMKLMVDRLDITGQVEWLGPLYGRDKIEAYVNADVLVMPSRYETWGLTFMEALACGTPVIMSDVCEAAKILPADCGISVPLNEGALAEAIRVTLDRGLANIYRSYRREWVKQYSWANLVPRILKLYEEVLK